MCLRSEAGGAAGKPAKKAPRKPAGQAAKDALKAAAKARRAGRAEQAAAQQAGQEDDVAGRALRDKEIGEESDADEEDDAMDGPDAQLVRACSSHGGQLSGCAQWCGVRHVPCAAKGLLGISCRALRRSTLWDFLLQKGHWAQCTSKFERKTHVLL